MTPPGTLPPSPRLLLLALLLLPQPDAARAAVPSFLSDSPPASLEGSGRAVDGSSPAPAAYDESLRYSGADLAALTSDTAGGCKAQCEAAGGPVGTSLAGFGWYDDGLLPDGSADGSPSGDGNYCVCYRIDGSSQTASLGGFEGGTSYGSAVAGGGGGRYGWGYCYGCVTVEPSAQPSSRPSEEPSVSVRPSSQPSENPSTSAQPTSIPSEKPSTSAQPSSAPSEKPSVSHWPTSLPSRGRAYDRAVEPAQREPQRVDRALVTAEREPQLLSPAVVAAQRESQRLRRAHETA
ncbi:hypothetical protein THAOC_11497 [Thalassiosira oceanica]|uniref:Uncharacterized protein n=1 Tax=Thalassiosira oceanica TaxID=159749 RepID=K0SMC4_THAOC|nr:hypothetical protein THAOC_11497 [Thalassiosira oceanica]|eukprot:EJK67463.1 hypothetical protein THAOC_11497 [Thalassiosira oceanica]